MKEILADAIVLVSFLTDRNAEQQELASDLFQEAANRKLAVVIHSISLIEAVHVFTRIFKADPIEVAGWITSLLEMPGVTAVGDVDWGLVLDRWPRILPSFGDAILAAVAAQGGYQAVATFDLDLRSKLARQQTPSYWPA